MNEPIWTIVATLRPRRSSARARIDDPGLLDGLNAVKDRLCAAFQCSAASSRRTVGRHRSPRRSGAMRNGKDAPINAYSFSGDTRVATKAEPDAKLELLHDRALGGGVELEDERADDLPDPDHRRRTAQPASGHHAYQPQLRHLELGLEPRQVLRPFRRA